VELYQKEMLLFSIKTYSLNLFDFRFERFGFWGGSLIFIIFYFYRYRIDSMLTNKKKIGQVSSAVCHLVFESEATKTKFKNDNSLENVCGCMK
jgi:hypothetical protein